MTIASFSVRDALADGSLLALPLVLLGGLLAGLNPCCLPLFPAAAGCCAAGRSNSDHPVQRALAFVLGTAFGTSLLGLVAALAGRVVGQFGAPVRYAMAAIPLLMGLHLAGFLRLPFPAFPIRIGPSIRLGIFGTGLLMPLAVTPCSTPVVASVLSFVAYRGNASYGAFLLFVYGIGVGMPLFLLGTVAAKFACSLEKYGFQAWADRLSGAALLFLGFYLAWKA